MIWSLVAAEPSVQQSKRRRSGDGGEDTDVVRENCSVSQRCQIGQRLCMAEEGSLARLWTENGPVSSTQSTQPLPVHPKEAAAATGEDQVGLMAIPVAPPPAF